MKEKIYYNRTELDNSIIERLLKKRREPYEKEEITEEPGPN